MNERIKELAEQARAWVNNTDNVSPDIEYVFYKDAYDKKFAELIIKECVEICNQAILQNQDTLSKLGVDELAEKMIIHGSINQAQKLGKGIKQHFGVEE